MEENNLAASMKKLYLNADMSDVTFVIGEERLPAHRTILALTSEHFRALLFGDFTKSNNNEILLSVNLQAFKAILKFIYTGSLEISEYDDNLKTEIINLAAEYRFNELVSQKIKSMSKSLNFDNFVNILSLARIHNVKTVYEKALEFVDLNASKILMEIQFLSLPKEILIAIIQRDSFAIDELDIFKAVMKWAESHSKKDLKEVLYHVRFVLMQINEIRKFVEVEDLFESDEIENMIKQKRTLTYLPYRSGQIHRSQMECDLLSTSNEYGYEWENEGKMFTTPLLFKLSSEKTVNFIKLCLSNILCSYYIEVSRDQREWTRVVDYTNYRCHQIQFIYFKTQPINFICIVPTYIYSKSIRITKLEVNYKIVSVPKVVNGFVAPKLNSNRGPFDISTFDKHSLGTGYIPSEVTQTHCQPIYANCLYLKLNDSNCKVSCIETRNNANEIYKKIDYQSDWLGMNYFFEPQVISTARVTFTKAKTDFVYQFYYHHGHSVFYPSN